MILFPTQTQEMDCISYGTYTSWLPETAMERQR